MYVLLAVNVPEVAVRVNEDSPMSVAVGVPLRIIVAPFCVGLIHEEIGVKLIVAD